MDSKGSAFGGSRAEPWPCFLQRGFIPPLGITMLTLRWWLLRVTTGDGAPGLACGAVIRAAHGYGESAKMLTRQGSKLGLRPNPPGHEA